MERRNSWTQVQHIRKCTYSPQSVVEVERVFLREPTESVYWGKRFWWFFDECWFLRLHIIFCSLNFEVWVTESQCKKYSKLALFYYRSTVKKNINT